MKSDVKLVFDRFVLNDDRHLTEFGRITNKMMVMRNEEEPVSKKKKLMAKNQPRTTMQYKEEGEDEWDNINNVTYIK